MGNYKVDPELMHYGVKGMKWGVRRTPAQLGHKDELAKRYKRFKKDLEKNKLKRQAEKKKADAEKAVKRKAAQESKLAKKKAAEAKKQAKADAEAEAKKKENIRLAVKGKKSMDELSDTELAEATRRLRAEKEYRALLQDTGKINKGKTAVDTFLKEPAKKIFFDTSVDLAAQAFKSVGADKVNKWFDKNFGIDIDFKKLADDDLEKQIRRRENEEKYANLMGKGRLERVSANNKKK